MELVNQSLSGLDDLTFYQILAMIIFFIAFIGIVFYVIRVDKNFINQMSNLPLDSEITTDNK
jgi:cytochrome c oxidase cbb3-type subunit IV